MTAKRARKNKKPFEPRSLAWDQVSFSIPSNWELAAYRFPTTHVSRVEIEDEYTTRMEAEWTLSARPRHVAQLMKRYKERVGTLTKKAHDRAEVSGCGYGWTMVRYSFKRTEPDKTGKQLEVVERELVTGVFVDPGGKVSAFVLLHFLPDDEEDPVEAARLVARDFAYQAEGDAAAGCVRWRVYDLDFEMPREFVLENTRFDIGAKLFAFRWRSRRLQLWQFSCADVFLKPGVKLEEWVAGYLNTHARLKGIAFWPGEKKEALSWRRRFPHVFAHGDEIVRWCFRYAARYRHDAKANRVVAWVFSHRSEADLEALPAWLKFGGAK